MTPWFPRHAFFIKAAARLESEALAWHLAHCHCQTILPFFASRVPAFGQGPTADK
jgi:hypothetical protein